MKQFLQAVIALSLSSQPLAHAQAPATQPASKPSEIRHGTEMSGSREARMQAYYEKLLFKIEPSGHGDVARLPQYLDFFTSEFVHDQRTFAWELTSERGTGDRAIIHGYFEFAESKTTFNDFLKHLNLTNIDDQTELLPAASLGQQRFAVVTANHTFVYDKPNGKRETLTECSNGDALFALKVDGSAVLCHAPSGYVGYVDAKNVRLIDEEAFSEIEKSIAVQHGSKVSSMIATATKYMGVKYVWGGNSSDGIDCSGLVLNAFKSIGVIMPRDADQQFLVGQLVATRWHRSGLRRGDTLYFLSRRGTIHHTAIYLGDNKFLEATEPTAKISSFDPKDPDYSEKRDKSFCFGKRVIE